MVYMRLMTNEDRKNGLKAASVIAGREVVVDYTTGLKRVHVNTDTYRNSHGKQPRGRGNWWFDIAGESYAINAYYTEAKNKARAYAVMHGVRFIQVLP
jgi:hypothetical protein